jgi:hypothetical protein
MDIRSFKVTLSGEFPPESFGPHLRALWYDARDNWDEAHHIIQDLTGQSAAWIHAYLHRKEGDNSNAAYWYRRAGKVMASGLPEREWEALVTAM